tara:strand:+ start:902 stop:1591 length:690 start_codon:yes stop_codon:yes gene_type:complete
MKYFISAPFGNYLKLYGAISVTGSWTYKHRPGLLPQILKTLRYSEGGWRNKIGLRNDGITEGLKKSRSTDILSLAAIDHWDWINMDSIVPKNASLEINISCPNIDKDVNPTNLPGFDLWPNINRDWCICKVPPTVSKSEIDKIVDSGYHQIHASNTLYSINGGRSGKILKPYTIEIIDYIKNKYPNVTIIAGGGVTDKKDAEYYFNRGADYVSLGTVCFTPWRLKGIID